MAGQEMGRVLRSEWIKFRSLRLMVSGTGAAVVLMVALSALTGDREVTLSSPLGTCRFVHQPLIGDGTVTARVAAQDAAIGDPTGPQAKAGVMIKENTDRQSRYAALMLTADLGVRLQANFTTDLAGSTATAPRWLRLTRSGGTITGYESSDGTVWTEIGTVNVGRLPDTVQVGLFAAAPYVAGNVSDGTAEAVAARFDNVRVTPVANSPWRHTDIGSPEIPGFSTEVEGIFLVGGTGDLWYPRFQGIDRVRDLLQAVLIALLVVVAVSVYFVTSEHARGMLRTTFAATPRRGLVLAAKAVVVGGAAFAAGLVGAVALYLLGVARDRHDFVPAKGLPPLPSLSDSSALRAVVGTALFLGVLAAFSLAVGAILRRTAAAITLVAGLVLLPYLFSQLIPAESVNALVRITPAAGLAIQQTIRVSQTGDPVAIGPWPGFAVLCGYALVALGLAYVLIRRRDT